METRIKYFKDMEGLQEFAGYAIDVNGNVWSYKNNKIKKLKPGWAKSRDGYLSIRLADPRGKKHSFYIHRLVALAFIPTDNCKEKRVKHLNGDITDNRVENLDWYRRGESRKKGENDKGYELDITITKRIKDIHTASVRKGLTIPSSYDFMKEIIEKGIQEHVRQYGLQKILHQMNQ